TRYAITGGGVSGASTLPVIVTPDAMTSYTIAALASGTYFFRVFPVVENGLGRGSGEATVTVSNPGAPGMSTGMQSTLSGRDATFAWLPPTFGTSPSMYLVEMGTGIGQSDIAVVTATGTTQTRTLAAGTTWARVRAVNGAFTAGPSNEVSM